MTKNGNKNEKSDHISDKSSAQEKNKKKSSDNKGDKTITKKESENNEKKTVSMSIDEYRLEYNIQQNNRTFLQPFNDFCLRSDYSFKSIRNVKKNPPS